MSPPKSPGQQAGQLLSEDGRELIGRSVNADWELTPTHAPRVEQPPDNFGNSLLDWPREEMMREPWLAWRVCNDRPCECPAFVQRSEGMLDEFLSLEEGSLDDLRAFLARRGSLSFCIHLRSRHCDELLYERIDQNSEWYFWEPPAVYRYYARLFRAVLSIAAAAEAGERRDNNVWVGVTRMVFRQQFEPLNWPRDADGVKPQPRDGQILSEVIDMLMAESPVRLSTDWREFRSRGPFQISLTGGTFGLLAYQLSMAVQGGMFAICTHCRKTYAPTRRLPVGRDNYCFAHRSARKAAYKRRKRDD